MTLNWIQFYADSKSAAFSVPCQGDYNAHQRCKNAKGDRHGHLLFEREGEIALVPYCCYSQEGVEKLIDHLILNVFPVVPVDFVEVILGLPEIKALPLKMPPREQAIVAKHHWMEEQTRFIFVGP